MMPVSNNQLSAQLEAFQKLMEQKVTDLKTTSVANKNELLEKFESIETRLSAVETKIGEISTSHAVLEKQVDDNRVAAADQIQLLTGRIANLEETIENLQNIPEKVDKLTEVCEERTNRQLRETLVFKNVPEEMEDETYNDTKDVVANLISEHCGLDFQEVRGEIKRAHREANRRNGDDHFRQGKRLIFAAFHSWDLCQTVIETFKSKCIREADFNISADQKYGPLTSRRRSLALKKRKELKESGAIKSAYIDFPAKLMVNNGETDTLGKKVYKLHTNFSRHKLE
jgi:rubrerythrin